jgi:hypothetical protein
MPDEMITTLREELATLRAELTELRRDHHRLLDKIGLLPDEDGGPKPRYLQFDAECFGVRNSEKWLPIIMRADDDHASLIFMDRNNCVRAEFIIDDTGFRIETRNSQHQLAFQLAEAKDGTGQLCVCDAEGRPRAGMRVNESGGVVNVVDPHGKPQAVLLAQPSGGEIFVVNAMHRAGVTLRASEVGGQVLVHEPSGQLMGHFSATNDMGALSVYGEHGSMAATLAGSGEGGRLAFHNLDGAVESVLPER